jgi:hypothetical protein
MLRGDAICQELKISRRAQLPRRLDERAMILETAVLSALRPAGSADCAGESTNAVTEILRKGAAINSAAG